MHSLVKKKSVILKYNDHEAFSNCINYIQTIKEIIYKYDNE